MWMRLKHPNIVRCLGATVDPPQIVMDFVPNGEVLDYVGKNPNVNRAHLVSSLVFVRKELPGQCGATSDIGLDQGT